MTAFEPAVLALADALRARGWKIVTAESCTGGLIAAACTEVAGSSEWFERGFVTYSNEAKAESLKLQLSQAKGDVTARIEDRMKRVKRAYHARGAKLAQAWNLTKEALTA